MEKENPEKYDNKEWEVSTAQLLKVHGYADNYENAAKANRQAKTAMELAKEILNLSRHTFFIHLRFMEAAFVKIVPESRSGIIFMSYCIVCFAISLYRKRSMRKYGILPVILQLRI